MKGLNHFGISKPEILLPAKHVDYEKWAVVACDQYTSQPEYWNKVENIVADNPSTLRMILPEIYLEKPGVDRRIENINKTMKQYLEDGTLVPQGKAFVLVDRKTTHAASRKGLIVALDLEQYEYAKGAKSLARATEGTVIDRLPPRIRIRENALIELPHIMVLIDDPGRSVIEPVAEACSRLEKLYDFELMMNGGHIRGYKVDDESLVESVFSAMAELADPENYEKKYGVSAKEGILLYAVGDGNHSLAAAKAYWEKLKKDLPLSEAENHPARYALVELVNVHDEGLQFEPIHRVLFGVDIEALINDMQEFLRSRGCKAQCEFFSNKGLIETVFDEKRQGVHILPFITAEFAGAIFVENPGFNLEVATLQCFLDEYLTDNKNVRIDYIHGDEVVFDLGEKPGNMGFFLPPMDKHELFKTVILDGALPRKTFSMGEAEEKRFYLECRKIR